MTIGMAGCRENSGRAARGGPIGGSVVATVVGVAALFLASLPAVVRPPPASGQEESTVVRLPFPIYDGTLTPYSFQLGYPLVTLVYDTLLWRDAAGIPRPWLARSVSRSNGGRRLTIKLRSGVRWHDGRPLTARDVAFTFQFVRERFNRRFTPELRPVAGVSAADPLTVTIDLERPALGFDDQPLADLPILPRHLWQGLEGSRNVPGGLPVGSGPYRLVRAGPRRGYVFRANRSYFNSRPRVDRIQVPIIRRQDSALSALRRRRRVDMLPFSLPEEVAGGLRSGSGIKLSRGPLYAGTELLLNLRRPPFNNRAVRRTLARALDLRRIVARTGPGAPASRGYLHPASRWASRAVLQRNDLRAARRAFARHRPRSIEVLAPDNDRVRVEAGRQVVRGLRRAGGRGRLATVSPARLDAAIGREGVPADFQAAIVSIPPLASYDPDFLARLFGSGAALNHSGYRSGAFDALAQKVAAAPDAGSRRRAVAQELRLLSRDLPTIPLFFSEGAFPYRSAAHDGWVFVKGSGILDKRSFLRGRSRGTEPGASVADDEPSGSSLVFDVLKYGSLLVIAIALVVAAVALRSRLEAREG